MLGGDEKVCPICKNKGTIKAYMREDGGNRVQPRTDEFDIPCPRCQWPKADPMHRDTGGYAPIPDSLRVPEDRSWYRDGNAAVVRLNKQHADLIEARKEIERLRAEATLPAVGEWEFEEALDAALEYAAGYSIAREQSCDEGDTVHAEKQLAVARQHVLTLFRSRPASGGMKVNYDAAIVEMERQVAEFAKFINESDGQGDWAFDARKIVDAAVIELHKETK